MRERTKLSARVHERFSRVRGVALLAGAAHTPGGYPWYEVSTDGAGKPIKGAQRAQLRAALATAGLHFYGLQVGREEYLGKERPPPEPIPLSQ